MFLLSSAAFAQQPVVGIFYQFEQEPAALSYQAMVKETRALLDPAGVSVVWRKQGENSGAESFAKVLFVKFTGACKPVLKDTAAEEEEPTVRLGSARVAQGNVLPVAEINCSEIQRFIAQAPARQRGIALGWAMARVTAHELYHALLQTTGHGKSGLAKAVVSAGELLGRSFSFNREELRHFHAAFTPQ